MSRASADVAALRSVIDDLSHDKSRLSGEVSAPAPFVLCA